MRSINAAPLVIATLLVALIAGPLVAEPFSGTMETWTGREWQAMSPVQQGWFLRGFMVATYVTTYGMREAPDDQVEATRRFMAGLTNETDTQIQRRVSRYYATHDLDRPLWQVIFAGGR